MTRLGIALEAALEADALARSLALSIESTLGDSEAIAGALVLATAAAGALGEEVGQRLASRWPAAELVGTSFEGVVLDGRVWEGEPVVAVLAWSEGEGAPCVIACEGGAGPAELARAIESGMARAGDGRRGVLVLLPDALGTPGLAGLLAALVSAADEDFWLVGAAATGLDGEAARAWVSPGDPGLRPAPGELLVGVWIPTVGPPTSAPRVRSVGATRAASPWLEITACRPHWIDALEGEPPTDWIRRQLGLGEADPIEPHLERLLVRIARGCDRRTDPPDDPDAFEEHYVTGLDARRGAIGVPGPFVRFDRMAFALPDAIDARAALRAAVDALPRTPLLLQLGCPGRGASLHGDRDLESAIVAHQATGRRAFGVIAPFQLASEPCPDQTGRRHRLRVHATVLAAVGPVSDSGS
ncbi:MAG: FIST N-terminal domain-containing protein [Myxococcota bacterium]